MPLKERMDFKVKRFISISVNLHFCSHDDARSSLEQQKQRHRYILI